MTQRPIPAARGVIDFAGLRARHDVRAVLTRMGIDPPPGDRPFRVGAAALGMSHGVDDSQGVLIKPGEEHCWWAFHEQRGGDVVGLVRAATGLGLREAVTVLEQGGPIAVTRDPNTLVDDAGRIAARSSYYEDPDLDRTPVDRIMAINEQAWRYYTLPKLAEKARDYLLERGIDVTALEKATGEPLAGHTPRSPSGLVDQLQSRGFSAEELIDAGWAARPRAGGELRDRFRDRLLVPFRDETGRVLGVTGRAVTWSTDDRAPKYLNHPKTVTFDKSQVLYRPFEAQPVSSRASVVAVEGTLDALAISAVAARAGMLEHFAPVSQSGISLTPGVADRVAKISPRPPIVCGDSDEAGMVATARWASETMTRSHREVLAVTLPEGLDPLDWLKREGPIGLLAFSSWQCLADEDHVRPRPAGGVLAAKVLTDLVAEQPDKELWELAAPAVERLAVVAASVQAPGAAERFAREAAASLTTRIDGRPASWYVDQLTGHEPRPGRPPPAAAFTTPLPPTATAPAVSIPGA